jgi:serine/threonine protein kinase
MAEPDSPPPATPPPEPLRTSANLPEQFGRYRILRKLGEGGMGAVYLARDTRLDRPVALKVPNFTASDGPQALERFEREARAAATVSHPNLCAVYDVGEIDGVHYLTMEYIAGRPLADYTATGKPRPQRNAAETVRRLAAALQEAHRHGIIHRDLKPANIMLDENGRLVVMDFGLARRDREDTSRLTLSGVVVGTPAYMAPEQARGEGPVGPACDVYSLGVILYELLTGRLPFEGPAFAVLGLKLARDPTPPSAHRPGLDPRLEAICLRAMARRPEDRYATMDALAAALTEYLRGSRTAAPPRPAPPSTEMELSSLPLRQSATASIAVPPPSTGEATDPVLAPRGRAARSRWRRAGLGFAAVVVLAGLLAGVVLLRTRLPSEPPELPNNPPASPRLENLLVEGTVWKGAFTVRDRGSQSRMEIHVLKRVEAGFRGIHVARWVEGSAPKRFLRPVEGTVTENALKYQATAAAQPFSVTATWTGEALDARYTSADQQVTEVTLQREAPRPPSAQVVLSVFDRNDDEGWFTLNHDDSPQATEPIHVRQDAGNYFVSARDIQNGKEWGWHAPAKYRGDHSGKFGRWLLFSLWTSHVDAQPRSGVRLVRLRGAGRTLYVDGERLGLPQPREWKTYAIRLDASGGWKRFWDDGPATDEQIKQVLAAVTDLRIKGEYSTAVDVGSLDDVEFGAEDTFLKGTGK